MYRVKVIDYLDEIIELEDNIKFEIKYNLENYCKLNKKIYWNIVCKNLIAKKVYTILDNIAYKYEINKKKNTFYFVNEKDYVIEDAVNIENRFLIYSKVNNIYSFNIYILENINEQIFKNYSINYDNEILEINTKYDIENYFKKNNIQILDIEKVNSDIDSLVIPEYNLYIKKTILSYIKVIVNKDIEYDKLFKLVNIININLQNYKVIVDVRE